MKFQGITLVILKLNKLFISPQIFSDDEDTAVNKAEFKFLHYVTDGHWKFPKKDNVEIVDPKFVFYDPVQATSISKAGYHFEDDNNQASNVHRNIKTIN